MGIVPQFSKASLERMLNQKLENLTNAMVQRLQYVGETFVVNVRTKISDDPVYRQAIRRVRNATGASLTATPLAPVKVKKASMRGHISEATVRYADDTGALTSSVGFMVLQDGKVVTSNFEGTGKKAAVGMATGKAAAMEIAAKFTSGLTLVVVAGMQYAAAVESMGYDVLTGSSFIAERELKEALNAFANNK